MAQMVFAEALEISMQFLCNGQELTVVAEESASHGPPNSQTLSLSAHSRRHPYMLKPATSSSPLVFPGRVSL